MDGGKALPRNQGGSGEAAGKDHGRLVGGIVGGIKGAMPHHP